jgi:hypothetical protein
MNDGRIWDKGAPVFVCVAGSMNGVAVTLIRPENITARPVRLFFTTFYLKMAWHDTSKID